MDRIASTISTINRRRHEHLTERLADALTFRFRPEIVIVGAAAAVSKRHAHLLFRVERESGHIRAAATRLLRLHADVLRLGQQLVDFFIVVAGVSDVRRTNGRRRSTAAAWHQNTANVPTFCLGLKVVLVASAAAESERHAHLLHRVEAESSEGGAARTRHVVRQHANPFSFFHGEIGPAVMDDEERMLKN